ncbi:MAG: cardiolipin synthase [Gammaproteobacteria bacterium]|nr:cardiolipin synthase [Gammaproteobacteria bacterium]
MTGLFAIALHVFVAPLTAVHALLYKRDPRSALGWITVCLLFPIFGPFTYYLFGINRVRTRARKLRGRPRRRLLVPFERGERRPEALECAHRMPEHFREVARVSDSVADRPIVEGNAVAILHNGEQAYPPMLEAIAGARERVYLCSYIFETNATGKEFAAALSEATRRGVEVKVIVDALGELYSFPRAASVLKKQGIDVARFLPFRLLPPSIHINLRNHRKVLVVDGEVAFTGGMNIGDRHLLNGPGPGIRDVHFMLRGPVVSQLEDVFLESWEFCRKCQVPRHDRQQQQPGNTPCRTVTDGPDEDLDKLATILLGAISVARSRILIVTPYFLPSREMIGALQAAAARGIDVTILLPGKSNIPFVHWATRNILWELLMRGVRVYYQDDPFPHTKLFIIDGQYAHIGTANFDPRSLRLNFELIVELFDGEVAGQLEEHVDEEIARSREVPLDEVDQRSLPVRLRDAFFWLFSPYL